METEMNTPFNTRDIKHFICYLSVSPIVHYMPQLWSRDKSPTDGNPGG